MGPGGPSPRLGSAVRGCLVFATGKSRMLLSAPFTSGFSSCLSHRPEEVFSEAPQGGCHRRHFSRISKIGELDLREQAGLREARAGSVPVARAA